MLLALLLFLQNEPTGVIEGVVSNQITGAGVRRARVQATAIAGGGQSSTITDASGRFTLGRLRPGRYRVSAQHPSFPIVNDAPLPPFVEVTIDASESKRGVMLKLVPPGAVEGKVVDPDGDAIPNCMVMAYRYAFVVDGPGRATRRLVPRGQASANDLGEYRIFDLPRGGYYLGVRCDSQAVSHGEDAEVWTEQYYPSTDAIESATRLQIAAGADVSAVDFKMRRGKAYTVRGRISMPAGSGKPAGLFGTLTRVGAEMDLRQHGVGVSPDGNFQIAGITPGAYRLVVRSFDNGNAGAPAFFGETQVVVTDRGAKPVTLEMRLQPDISGTIEFDGPAEQMRQMRVWLQPGAHEGCAGGSTAEPTAAGTFVLKGITPGECYVTVTGIAGYLKSVTLAGAPAGAGHKIRIAAGSGGPLRLVVSTKVSELDGRVSGSEAGSTFVAVYGPNTSMFPVQDGGTFTLSNLPPGEYRVIAFQGTPVAEHILPVFSSRAKLVKLQEGERASVQVEPIPAAEIAAILEKAE